MKTGNKKIKEMSVTEEQEGRKLIIFQIITS